MNLKKATQLVYYSLIASLILSALQWGVYTLNFYGALGRGFSTVAGILHLFLSIPMILFFGALNAKQNNQTGSSSESAN